MKMKCLRAVLRSAGFAKRRVIPQETDAKIWLYGLDCDGQARLLWRRTARFEHPTKAKHWPLVEQSGGEFSPGSATTRTCNAAVKVDAISAEIRFRPRLSLQLLQSGKTSFMSRYLQAEPHCCFYRMMRSLRGIKDSVTALAETGPHLSDGTAKYPSKRSQISDLDHKARLSGGAVRQGLHCHLNLVMHDLGS